MRIGVDIDQVLNNMIEKILPMYNDKYGANLKFECIYQYDMKPMINPSCRNLFEEFANDELIASLDIAEGAVDVLTYLSKYHDIYFVTAGHPYTVKARDDWLGSHFPFYRSSNLIVCREKQMLNLDVLIDDYENNLIGGGYRGILVTKPWNVHVPTTLYGIERIFGWQEVPAIIERIERKRI